MAPHLQDALKVKPYSSDDFVCFTIQPQNASSVPFHVEGYPVLLQINYLC